MPSSPVPRLRDWSGVAASGFYPSDSPETLRRRAEGQGARKHDDHFSDRRQYAPGPFFRKAGAVDSSAARERETIEARLLDLRDHPMPFFDQAMPPAIPGWPPYEHDVVKKWTAQTAASDGFVFVTPEYNYGTSAVLKNAIDWVYPEWNRKAAAFVSYGSAMGARGVQQLRDTVIELQMAPIRSSVHIPVATLWEHFQGGDVEKGLAELEKQGNAMIDDLLWWTAALKAARGSR